MAVRERKDRSSRAADEWIEISTTSSFSHEEERGQDREGCTLPPEISVEVKGPRTNGTDSASSSSSPVERMNEHRSRPGPTRKHTYVRYVCIPIQPRAEMSGIRQSYHPRASKTCRPRETERHGMAWHGMWATSDSACSSRGPLRYEEDGTE